MSDPDMIFFKDAQSQKKSDTSLNKIEGGVAGGGGKKVGGQLRKF